MDLFADPADGPDAPPAALVSVNSCTIAERPLAITFQSAANFLRNGQQTGAGLVVTEVSRRSSLFGRIQLVRACFGNSTICRSLIFTRVCSLSLP